MLVLNRRYIVVSAILVAQAILLYGVSISEVDGTIVPLRMIPERIGKWQLFSEELMDPKIFEYLQPTDYISRQYTTSDGSGKIDLFVAYFQSLNRSFGPHSPKVCLPGAGWLIRSTAEIQADLPGWPRKVSLNRNLMERGDSKILVLHWYQNERHVYADEVMAKIYLLPDMLRYKRADVALVRVITPVARGGEEEQAMDLIRSLFPKLVEHFSGGRLQ